MFALSERFVSLCKQSLWNSVYSQILCLLVSYAYLFNDWMQESLDRVYKKEILKRENEKKKKSEKRKSTEKKKWEYGVMVGGEKSKRERENVPIYIKKIYRNI